MIMLFVLGCIFIGCVFPAKTSTSEKIINGVPVKETKTELSQTQILAIGVLTAIYLSKTK